MTPNNKGCSAAEPAERAQPATTPMVEQARMMNWMRTFWIEGSDPRGPLGYGATAFSIADATGIVRRVGYQLPDDASSLQIRTDVKPADIGHLSSASIWDRSSCEVCGTRSLMWELVHETGMPYLRVETNRRHGDPSSMSRESEHALCARPSRSAAVAHPRRSAN